MWWRHSFHDNYDVTAITALLAFVQFGLHYVKLLISAIRARLRGRCNGEDITVLNRDVIAASQWTSLTARWLPPSTSAQTQMSARIIHRLIFDKTSGAEWSRDQIRRPHAKEAWLSRDRPTVAASITALTVSLTVGHHITCDIGVHKLKTWFT